MVQNSPLVTVIIVNRNGIEFVDACLRSVLVNSYTNIEVLFVDNASDDGSLEYVKTTFGYDKRLHFIENSESVGPAVGRNRGIAKARGKYIAFLDNDTEVHYRWAVELVEVLEFDSTIGGAQSKLLRTKPRDAFDYAGDYLTPLGILSERAKGRKDVGQFDFICDIFSAKSAASIIRKDVLDEVGGFDEDFYMYLEETDLCWRVWLAGYRIVFIPKSVVYHAYGTKKKAKAKYYLPYIVRYYGCRNYITTLIKNFGFINLVKILPIHIFSWILLALMFLVRLKFMDAFWIIKAIVWNLTHPILLYKKRQLVQRNIRRVKDSQLMRKIMISQKMDYFLKKALVYIHGGIK